MSTGNGTEPGRRGFGSLVRRRAGSPSPLQRVRSRRRRCLAGDRDEGQLNEAPASEGDEGRWEAEQLGTKRAGHRDDSFNVHAAVALVSVFLGEKNRQRNRQRIVTL
jgi:hypothetical protein